MKFLAKATGLNGLAVWKGFYAEMKDGNEKTPVIIDVTEGVPHKIIPTTLKWCTGIQTGKAQDIFEGDQVEVWNDNDSIVGIVEWATFDAGWVVKDSDGNYHDLVGSDRYFVK